MRPMDNAKYLALAIALAACGGAKTTGPNPGGGTTTEPAPGGGAATDPAPVDDGPVTWDPSWSHDEKRDFMKAHVLPEMKVAFQGYSEERWGGFNCKSCHGDPWQDHPKDALPKLKLEGGDFDVPEDEKPIVAFMKSEVVPKMAALFGQKPFDPATGEGFGCGGCHTVDVVE